MKILVGILYSNEPQIKKCIESVKRQKGVEFDFFIIKNLPKNVAHDKLYKTFMEDQFHDLYVKLDADMVIQKDNFFNYLSDIFTQDLTLDWLHLWIYDHYLDNYISGLNVYRNSVEWNINKDNLFTDRTLNLKSVRHKNVITKPDTKWVEHCPFPSLKQAFNFGFHRSVKAFQFGIHNKRPNSTHGIVVRRLAISYLRKRSIIKLMAIRAFFVALENRSTPDEINKNNQKRENLYKTVTISQGLKYSIFTDFKFWLIFIFGKVGYYFLYYLHVKSDD
jgi:hypothetical protein